MLSATVNLFSKMNLKGMKAFLTIYTKGIESHIADAPVTVDNVMPAVFTKAQVVSKPKAAEFEIQMEIGSDGKQRVKVCQPIPFSVEEAKCDEDLMKKLLIANGMDLKELEFTDKVSGGMSQEVKVATVYLNDGSNFEILIKLNREANNFV